MPLVYSVISRGREMLCKYAVHVGNFTEVTESVLSKIQLTNHRMTHTDGNYCFHYECADDIICMCISDNDFPRQRAFHFLSVIRRKFLALASYGDVSVHSEFPRILSAEMNKCNESRDYDNIKKVHGQVDELKEIMVKNIESMVVRGDKLEALITEVDNLVVNAGTFRQSGTEVQRKLYWKNKRMYFYLGIFILITIYVIAAMICGIKLNKC